MNLYDVNGWCDLTPCFENKIPFILASGARGIGKTYSALYNLLKLPQGEKFLYLRRKQTQAELARMNEFNPFRPLEKATGRIITSKTLSRYHGAFYNGLIENEEIKSEGQPLGYSAALSTFSNVRGINADDISTCVYDEFIPEAHERLIKNEGVALLNLYETINRNRELQNPPRKPLKLICLSNSETLDNPIYQVFNLVEKAKSMQEKGQMISIFPERGIMLINFKNSPISQKKKHTALYKAAGGGDFSNIAIENRFYLNNNINVGSENISHAKPLVILGNICIYNNNQHIYLSWHISGNPERLNADKQGVDILRRKYNYIFMSILSNNIKYENYSAYLEIKKALFK